MTYEHLTEQEQDRIKGLFTERCKEQNIKYASKSYFKEQAIFFAGISAALFVLGRNIPPFWSIACMSDREIVDKF